MNMKNIFATMRSLVRSIINYRAERTYRDAVEVFSKPTVHVDGFMSMDDIIDEYREYTRTRLTIVK